MIGILVQLALSWFIIRLFEKGNLDVLGFYPTKRRLTDFAIFFFITALCCASDFLMRILFAGQKWELNPAISFTLIMEGVWWNVKSVLFEELIFRGVLLYILIKKLRASKAIIISSVTFGIYHWFSQDAWNNIGQMAILFIATGIMGLLYAYSYAKTFSLYVPIAIHLGWNLTRSVIFSETVIGDQLLVQVKPVSQVQVSYFVFLCILLIPMLSTLLINFYLLKKKKQVVLSS